MLFAVIFINYASSMKHKTNLINLLCLIQKPWLTFTLIAMMAPFVQAEENLVPFDAMDVFNLEWASDPVSYSHLQAHETLS